MNCYCHLYELILLCFLSHFFISFNCFISVFNPVSNSVTVLFNCLTDDWTVSNASAIPFGVLVRSAITIFIVSIAYSRSFDSRYSLVIYRVLYLLVCHLVLQFLVLPVLLYT